MRSTETVLVVALFLLQALLWSRKRRNLIKTAGFDPLVLNRATSNTQRLMHKLTLFLTVYVIIVIICHSMQIQLFGFFTVFRPTDKFAYDISGFIVGLVGLSLCLYAQNKMGKSWRVGIDTGAETELITSGVYKYIRNPTYLGLYLLYSGLWLIWSSYAVFIFVLLFFFFFEFQVRCEEDFLEHRFGQKYLDYKSRTKRYIPLIY